MMDINHIIISLDVEKELNKIQHIFMIKNNLNKAGLEETYFHIRKNHLRKRHN